jgi:RHS repeat-associated protein
MIRRILGTALLLLVFAAPAAAQETVEYYGLDALGSVRVLFDAQGAVIARMDRGPFGENLQASAKFPEEQFAGLARDATTGQDYALARSYSPSTGRFNRVDSVYSGLYEPQRWNRYAYALNCPLSYADANGRDPYPHMGLVGSGIGRLLGGHWETGVSANSENVPLIGGDGVFQVLPEETIENIDDAGGAASAPETPNDAEPRTDDCREFVEELTELTRTLSGVGLAGINGAGWGMMLHSRRTPDPWDGRNYRGFRNDLVEPNQGDDVYRHIYAHAGAALAWETGGALVHRRELNVDLEQARTNHPGAIAEVKGSQAGYEIGKIMRAAAVWRTYSLSSVRTQITKLICQ